MLLAKSYKIDTRVKNEAESLTAAGYNVTVLTWDRFGYHSANTFVNNVRIVSWRLLSGLQFSKIGYAFSAIVLQLYCFFWCLANMRRPYVVQCNDFNTLLAGVALKIARPSTTKLVYDCHELTPSAYAEWYSYRIGLVAGAIERLLVKFTDSIITVSPPIKTYLLKLTSKPVTVIYNTIKIDSIPKQDKNWWRHKFNLSGFVVSYVGLLRQDVGLDELIDSARYFKEAKSSKIKFLIVGDGPDLRKTKERAKDLSEYVTFVPRVPHSEALGYVTASDISYAVYRNKGESDNQDLRTRLAGGNTLVASPWKVFEGMACGTCVMVRTNTFTWQFVSDLGYGIPAGSGTSEEISKQISWAMANGDRLESMSGEAKRHFYEEFNWERMSDLLVRLYDSL